MNTTSARTLRHGPGTHSSRQATSALALLALGVVYGDIGTSPLYAAKETFIPRTASR